MSRFKLSFVTLLCISVMSTSSFAEESKVTPLNRGQVAPWSGVLFSNSAAAEVAAMYKTLPEKIKIERNNEKKKCDAECEKSVSDMIARHDRELEVLRARNDTLTSENNRTKELLIKQEKERTNTVIWTGIGFGAGLVITTISFIIVGSVTK